MNRRIVALLDKCEDYNMDLFLWHGASLMVGYAAECYSVEFCEDPLNLLIWGDPVAKVDPGDITKITIKTRINLTVRNALIEERNNIQAANGQPHSFCK